MPNSSSQSIPLVHYNEPRMSPQTLAGELPPGYSQGATWTRSRGTTGEEKRCRICLNSSDDDDKEDISADNPLIRPCLCKGSMAYVHLACLQRWRQERSENAFTCEVCHYKYDLRRPFWAKLIGSRVLVAFITLVLVLAVVTILSLLVKVIDVYGFHHYPNPHNQQWLRWHGTIEILWLDRFYVLIGVLLTGFLGIVFLCVALATRHRYDWNILSPSVFLCGGVGFDAGAFIIIIIILYGIIAAFSGVFQFVHTLLSKLMVHAKERIIEVST
ncbi:hypothetical protein Unana1_01458 [Umbelopsis nana]